MAYLVCTPAKAKEYITIRNAHLQAVNVEVNPEKCKTKSGAWLASNVTTTFRDDDMSILKITHRFNPIDSGLYKIASDLIGHINANAGKSSIVDFETVSQSVSKAIVQTRKKLKMSGSLADKNRVTFFEWPVFGSKGTNAETPEQFFDECAREIVNKYFIEKIEINTANGFIEMPSRFYKSKSLFLPTNF